MIIPISPDMRPKQRPSGCFYFTRQAVPYAAEFSSAAHFSHAESLCTAPEKPISAQKTPYAFA